MRLYPWKKTFGSKLLLLPYRHHVMELLCETAAFMVYNAAGSVI